MADLASTLRDKWDTITPRERRLVVVLGVSVPIILLLFVGLQIRDGLEAMERRNGRMRRALAAIADLRSRGSEVSGDDVLKKMPSQPIGLESYLSRAAEKVGVTISSFNPLSTVEKDGFSTHGTQFDLANVTVDQAKDFLEAIETESRYVLVTSLTVNRDSADKAKLDLRLQVSTYSRPKPAEASDAAKPEGSGGGS
jgi:hypothetical protein